MIGEATIAETSQAAGFLPGGGQGQPSADARLRVVFGPFAHPNADKSVLEGRPIFDEITYITIYVPGERDIVHRKAYQRDFDRFPFQYQAFLNKKSQDHAGGTPLKVLTWMSIGQVKELEFFNCYTVEQLANMPDSAAKNFLAIQGLKTRAKDFLQASKEAAPLLALRTELDQRDSQISALQAQINDLVKKLDKKADAKAA
jgi:hypothetical protein